MAEEIRKDVGAATAYAEAVNAGYTGTKAQFEEALAAIAAMTAQAQTLSPGSSATASYNNGVLSLGIPRGADGQGIPSGGTAGQVIVKGDNEAEWSDDLSNVKSAIAHKGSVTLSATWSGSDPYTQSVTVTGLTVSANDKIDLQPTAAQLAQLISDGVLALYVENNNGTLTAYAVGGSTSAAMSIQCTVSGVIV